MKFGERKLQDAGLRRFGELPYGARQAAQQRLLGSCILGVFYHKIVLKYISGKHNQMLAS